MLPIPRAGGQLVQRLQISDQVVDIVLWQSTEGLRHEVTEPVDHKRPWLPNRLLDVLVDTKPLNPRRSSDADPRHSRAGPALITGRVTRGTALALEQSLAV